MNASAGVATEAIEMPMCIDAHHHLWHYFPEEFSWIDDSMAALRRDFLPIDISREMVAASVDATIAVQARRSIRETEFLLDSAPMFRCLGVVGWVPLEDSHVGDKLDQLRCNPYFVGVREVTQGQLPGFLDDPGLNAGIREITARDLSYDILIYANQLEEATRMVNRHGNQRFILDHAAKPPIAAGGLHQWRADIEALAKCENVSCKLSGLATEANWLNWDLATISPYLDICVEAFTPQRLIAGSDWPVCLTATTYAHWWHTLRHYFKSFSSADQEAVFGLNAHNHYKIQRSVSTKFSRSHKHDNSPVLGT